MLTFEVSRIGYFGFGCADGMALGLGMGLGCRLWCLVSWCSDACMFDRAGCKAYFFLFSVKVDGSFSRRSNYRNCYNRLLVS